MLYSTLVVFLCGVSLGLSEPSKREKRSVPDGAYVSLTELISSGQISEAQEAARVYPALFEVESYAHFFTVNKTSNSDIFFWYFPVVTGDKDAPLVLWLQGGPGTSFLTGLFTQNGPVSIGPGLSPERRHHAWNKQVNLLYLENPVGTGFSSTEDSEGYSTNMDEVGINLYAALIQFLDLFPDLQHNPFFITGISFAGKFIPALGHYIHTLNPSAEVKVNLQGLAIANGIVDLPDMLDYGNHFYQIGLIDDHGKAQFEDMESKAKALMQQDNWEEAALVIGSMIMGPPLVPFCSLFTNLTRLINNYNYLYQDVAAECWVDYVNQPSVRHAIHVYNRTFNNETAVLHYLARDLVQSVKPWLEELVEHYRVLIFTGQLDCIVGPKQVQDYLKTMKFSHADEYLTASRSIWWVEGFLAGYVKTAGLLTELVVRNAGHIVPADQPVLTWDLLDRFVHDQKFDNISYEPRMPLY